MHNVRLTFPHHESLALLTTDISWATPACHNTAASSSWSQQHVFFRPVMLSRSGWLRTSVSIPEHLWAQQDFLLSKYLSMIIIERCCSCGIVPASEGSRCGSGQPQVGSLPSQRWPAKISSHARTCHTHSCRVCPQVTQHDQAMHSALLWQRC